MEIIDFLNLLKIFNEKGIHFKWEKPKYLKFN